VSGIGGWAAQAPDAPALLSLRGPVSFAELDQRQKRLAGHLVAEGLGIGDRVGILAQNSNEILEVCGATLRAGIVPVPINAHLTDVEVEYIVQDARLTWLFTDRTVDLTGLPNVVTFGDAYERVLHEAVAIDLDDHLLGRPMHYTSGTTGHPKGVYVEPYDPAEAERLSLRFRSMWDLAPDEIHLVCSPLAHSAPLRFSLRTLEAGGAVVVQERFDAEATMAAIDLFGVTSAFMVPTHLKRILALGRKGWARYDISSIRTLVHAGAPIDEQTKRKVIELFPEGSVWEFYGSTEGQATQISGQEWARKPGSVGRAHPGAEVLIAGEEGNPSPPGEVGQVWVRDPEADAWTYWDDPAKTAAAWKGDAFTVGDLGWLDEDGYLFLAGRLNDVIITGGVNVYPQEIENVLEDHPGVDEAVVFGAPDEEWGEKVCARVVLHDAPLTADELKVWARERLAGFKVPKEISFVAELERTPTGKVKRHLNR
jgi:long-chain acyl-CoA synthetase